ncbi:MAG: hypothetical protein A3F82_10285 [Deltaproteobacteria bacterium RIFCSPLOWO2_12_FULL_44_12]|nr:MAG: hypothetical protein A2712_07785 [Deltaproteobacteria bacterium RIFCSPHIGHO2_01_FULL_43_49]OGQ14759.1 MAG: hypothetical protein A3D22_09210 [Deltaproteobacteria bacterium RIFCSPHIGHO2_02_FULL_44_53]OGQ28145.1 MAG: hypothetical protein A3D98_07920 [Deltaproteobacteria bacterium RIFCSPHIGHO2_12_FULL_44_21]OGQ31357.1 MAG: hypothetical protein A2979_07970 [Deltaproteobacteria bacterium RIFCSPLOWO2_01_FULL_45_74]OGQ43349.1 MAG: hypothetical protein A3I70_01630 [Deltaproteobacteria bacterium 
MDYGPRTWSLSLKRPIFYSILAHLICLGLILYVPKLPLLKPKVKVVWVELPKGASENIEIKIKEAENLPKTTIQQQKEQAEQQSEPSKEKPMVAPKEEPKPQPKPTLRPIQAEPKPKPKKISDVQKALAALNKKKPPAPPEAAQVKDKGEGFKYGTGTEPLRVPPTDPEYVAYQAKIRFKIMQEWIIPGAYLELPTKPKTSIVVMINQQGEIVTTDWEERSSNLAFDSSCMRAVQRASPLPVPPQRLEWEAYNEGFLVQFDPSLKMQLAQ